MAADAVTVATLFVGLAVLAKSSEAAVNGALRLSRLLGISEAATGFIFLAVMTSLPEIVVTIFAGLSGSALGVATLFGSNIVDIALVFAAMSFVATFYISKKDLAGMEQALLITALVALFALVLGGVNFTFGVFGVLLFFGLSYALAKEGVSVDGNNAPSVPVLEKLKHVFTLLAAVIVIVVSANFVTSSSIEIARSLSISEAIIGATLVAIGTSLPELAVGVEAVRRAHPQLAVGNIVGSLVANLTLLLGVAGLVSFVAFDAATRIAVLFMFATYGVFYILARDEKFALKEALVLSATFVVFVALLLMGV